MEGMSLPVRAVRTVNPYVRVLLKAAVYGSFVYFLYFCIYYATDKFWDDDFATAINTWTIPSNYEDKAHDVYSYGFALLLVLVVWLPLLGGTLIVIVTRRLPGSQPKYMRYFQEKVRWLLIDHGWLYCDGTLVGRTAFVHGVHVKPCSGHVCPANFWAGALEGVRIPGPGPPALAPAITHHPAHLTSVSACTVPTNHLPSARSFLPLLSFCSCALF